MAKALADHFISSYEYPPLAIIIDLDPYTRYYPWRAANELVQRQISGLLLLALNDI